MADKKLDRSIDPRKTGAALDKARASSSNGTSNSEDANNYQLTAQEAAKLLEDEKTINKLKLDKYPIIIAKTQYSLSDNAKLIGAPKDFDITIRDIEIRNGAGFLVALAGDMMLMPGLSKTPAGVGMKITNSGKISGLF